MPEFSTEELSADLAAALTPDHFDGAARRSLAAFDVLNAAMLAEVSGPIACRAGCSLCCSLRVDVFAHEVFPIARHIRARFTEDQQTQLSRRLAAHAAAVLPLTPYEHATRNVACPMLENGCCSVYEVRPQSCRRHHSRDLAVCEYIFDHPTDLETPAAHDRELFHALSAAMGQNIEAYAEHGFDHTIYELGTAVGEALAEEASEARWRARETAFHFASITPAD